MRVPAGHGRVLRGGKKVGCCAPHALRTPSRPTVVAGQRDIANDCGQGRGSVVDRRALRSRLTLDLLRNEGACTAGRRLEVTVWNPTTAL